MSMFSFPDAMTPETMMKSMPDLGEWMKDMPALPMSPLMVHPAAASAAAAALGFGVAGHMAGLFLGALEGATEASRRFGAPFWSGLSEAQMSAWSLDWMQDAAPAAASPKVRPIRKDAETQAKAAADAIEKTTETASRGMAGLKSAADAAVAAVAEASQASGSAAAQAVPAVEEAMKRPAEMAKPKTPDDLKRISGIGPKLEQVLNGLGIWTFAQVAALQAAEIAWLDDYLQFRGRIERDAWKKQAAEFAASAG